MSENRNSEMDTSGDSASHRRSIGSESISVKYTSEPRDVRNQATLAAQTARRILLNIRDQVNLGKIHTGKLYIIEKEIEGKYISMRHCQNTIQYNGSYDLHSRCHRNW